MTDASPRDEVADLEQQIAELKQSAAEIRRRVGEGWDAPTDSAEIGSEITQAEELEALARILEERLERLRAQPSR